MHWKCVDRSLFLGGSRRPRCRRNSPQRSCPSCACTCQRHSRHRTRISGLPRGNSRDFSIRNDFEFLRLDKRHDGEAVLVADSARHLKHQDSKRDPLRDTFLAFDAEAWFRLPNNYIQVQNGHVKLSNSVSHDVWRHYMCARTMLFVSTFLLASPFRRTSGYTGNAVVNICLVYVGGTTADF